MDYSVTEISVALIKANRHQPRFNFDENGLNELAKSIQQNGLLQPILLRELFSDQEKESKYEIIAGERRFRACCLLSFSKIPAIIKEVSIEESCEMALIENIQRKDLNWIEKAHSYRRCMKIFHMTQEQLALKIGVSRSSVANTIRLLNLPKEIQSKIKGGEISFAHAKILLSLPSKNKQEDAVKNLIKDNMSSSELSQYLKNKNDKKSDESVIPEKTEKIFQKRTHDVVFLEKKLMTIFNLPVKILQGDGNEFLIKFQSWNELNSLLDKVFPHFQKETGL